MSNYSCHNILKSKAKELARTKQIRLCEALEFIARKANFANYHELSTVAKTSPIESRLTQAALGEANLRDVIHSYDAHMALSITVDKAFSEVIPPIDGLVFTVENIEVDETHYNEETGVLVLELSFEYQASPFPHFDFSGKSFWADAVIQLVRRNDKWQIAKDGLVISDLSCDAELDWPYPVGEM